MLLVIFIILITVIFLLDALTLVTWQASLAVLGFVTMAVWARWYGCLI